MNRLKELRKQHWLTLDDVEEELGIGSEERHEG